MNFQNSIKTCFQKFADFNGRASRSEFWYFYLFAILVYFISIFLAIQMPFFFAVAIIFGLVLFVPALAVTARRLHDTGRSGWWRLDTLFKKNKYIDLKIISDGGWHFTEIKTPEEIYKKHLNDEHHDEFQLTGINLNDVKNMVQERYIHYDHNIDKKNLKEKWSKDVKIKLSKIEDNFLPKYLKINKEKYKNWFDNG